MPWAHANRQKMVDPYGPVTNEWYLNIEDDEEESPTMLRFLGATRDERLWTGRRYGLEASGHLGGPVMAEITLKRSWSPASEAVNWGWKETYWLHTPTGVHQMRLYEIPPPP